MNTPFARFILLATLLACGSGWRAVAQTPPPAGAAVPNTPGASHEGPKIQFAESEHDFGKIENGAIAKFEFAFTNTGTATLEIIDVRPSCGCTTTGVWSKKVEPGQRGTIPIQFNSGTFSGPVHKIVTVTSNAPGQPQTVLSLKATVWRAIDVSPPTAYFTPQAGAQEVQTRVVRIVNNTEVPLELSPPECANPAFTAELQTLKAGKEYEVRIAAKPPFSPGSSQGAITLKTSSKTLPLITLPAVVMVQLPLTAMPAQLALGPAPLAVATKLAVTVRNSSSAAVTLAEPTVNVPGVTATVQELQPGRVFNIMLEFPQGFAIQAAASAELSVKTSDPQFPLLRVPIFHTSQAIQPPPTVVAPRPTVAAAPALARDGAKIEFAQPIHDFGMIDSGASINFDYVFTNTGTASLEISAVQSSCACITTGAWSRKVEPGQTGTIPIVFHSDNLSGAVHKVVAVTSNAATQPRTILSVKGTVWRAIDVNPPAVYFTPQADGKAVETHLVRIVNNSAEPLELSPPESTNSAFTAELRTLKEGKEFEVRIAAKPPFDPGTSQGAITLKTSSKVLPVIRIEGVIMVQLPIMAMPSQLLLGPAPLVAATKLGVILRNGGSAPVTVSDPTVNVPGVTATLKELQPGRIFNVMLDFPVGCEIKTGAGAALSVKTSHPQYPVIRVPIAQAPPASPPQPAVAPPRPAG